MRVSAILPAMMLVPTLAAAQDGNDSKNYSSNIGVATVAMPTYMGSNRYRVRVVPIFQLEFRQRFYLGASHGGTGIGTGAYLVRNSAFSWAAEVTGDQERKESFGDGLAGMGKRGGATYAATHVSYQLGFITAGAGVGVGLGSGEGSWSVLKLDTKHQVGARWIAGLSTGATFSNGENMAFDFGVTPEQAVSRQALIDGGDSRLSANEGRAYTPEAGLKQMHLSTSLGYLLTNRMTAMAFATGTRLGQEAADSPLTRQRNGVTAGMGIAYGF
jgi:MipA family protein